jgi:AGZA family xanthine/uracil permease-like MFS transporter
MGLNAYFTFQVVGANGSGIVPYRTALTAIFMEGIIFIILALTGMRQWLVKLIPSTLKTATGVGIGLFLTEIGLSYSAGIGAITGGWISTPLTLGGCPMELINYKTGMCESGKMSNPTVSRKYGRPSSHFVSPVTDIGAALGGNILRRHGRGRPDGIPHQLQPHHRNVSRLYSLMAVCPTSRPH